MMNKELFTLAEKIKLLREQRHLTQAELAKEFCVSTDYLLGLEENASINVSGLSEKEVAVLCDLVSCFKNKRI